MLKSPLALALGLAAALPAMACPSCDAAAASAGTTPTVPLATSADALTVVRDAETGQLRAPTAEEAAALARRQADRVRAAPAAAAAITSRPLVRRGTGAAVNVRLTPEFASYAVVVRQPDGRLAESCVHAPDGAGALAQVKAAAAPATPTAELQ